MRNIYFKTKVLHSLDNLEFETRDGSNDTAVEKEIKSLIELRKTLDNDYKTIIEEEYSSKLSPSKFFALLAIIFTFVGVMLSVLGKGQYDKLNKPIENFLKNNEFYIAIGASAFVALLSGVTTLISWKIKSKE